MNNNAPISKNYDKNLFREHKAKNIISGFFDILIFVSCFLTFIGIGGLFFFIGCNELHNISASTKFCDVLVQGTVKEYNSTNVASGKSLHTPVIVYEYNGKEYKYAGNHYSSGDNYIIGQNMDIYISSDNPYKVYIPLYDGRNKEVYIQFAVIGGVFCFGSLILLIIITIKKIGKKRRAIQEHT